MEMSTSLVNNKYRITRRIGGGSFGEIYMGIGPAGEKVSVVQPSVRTLKSVSTLIYQYSLSHTI